MIGHSWLTALCVAGTYSPGYWFSAFMQCLLGNYCPAGASQPNLCLAGSVRRYLNLIVACLGQLLSCLG